MTRLRKQAGIFVTNKWPGQGLSAHLVCVHLSIQQMFIKQELGIKCNTKGIPTPQSPEKIVNVNHRESRANCFTPALG